jgi:replication fork protection complex subunit Tof1/Swi1
VQALENMSLGFWLTSAFFASIMKDIRMERSKIRPSDNIRTFYLSRFFMEYLLLLRHKEAEQNRARKEREKQKASTAAANAGANGISNGGDLSSAQAMNDPPTELVLALVGEMAEMDSVRWVVTRLKVSMDERVSHCDQHLGGGTLASPGTIC